MGIMGVSQPDGRAHYSKFCPSRALATFAILMNHLFCFLMSKLVESLKISLINTTLMIWLLRQSLRST